MKLKGKRVVVTGGGGTLGKVLIPILQELGANVQAPSHQELPVDSPEAVASFFTAGPGLSCDLVVHLASFTDVPGAQFRHNHSRAISTNIFGTAALASWTKERKVKMVYISTDYVYEGTSGGYSASGPTQPTTFYGFTKLAGECYLTGNDLIIRTSFVPRGYWGKGEGQHTKVFNNVHTSKDWVDIIAGKIAESIEMGDVGIVNIGTEKKTLKDLAVQEYPEVEEVEVESFNLGYRYPTDTSMNLDI